MRLPPLEFLLLCGGGGVWLEIEQHGGEIDAGDAVDERVVGLGDQREPVALEPLDQPGLPQRLVPVERLGGDPRGQQKQLLLAAGRRQRRVADVVLDVEVGIVDPQGPAGLERRGGEFLPVARHQVQTTADMVEEVGELGWVPLEDQDSADVHVRGRPLLVEERGVGRAEAVQVSLRHGVVSGERTVPAKGIFPNARPTLRAVGSMPEKLLLAAPRGYCAGVDRAVQTVERALELYGAPVYVRKEIVHNKFVVEQLRERGAVFVESESDVPEGATVVFSAHGVAPSVHANARERRLETIDATCPLVTKVHVEAKKFAADGYTIVLIGHAGHEEVEGTMGEAPEHIVLVESEDDVDRLEVPDPSRIAYISQTTLSVDETRAIINRLRERFPAIVGPRTDDICYATTNRQAAVKQLAHECDLVLVIGSTNSSNSNRLVEVAREHGADSHLIDNETEVREEWLAGKRVVGITSGASAPESLVQRLVEFFRARGTTDVQELEVVHEDVRFMLPKVIRQAVAAGSA